jgi:hypothetical protein
MSDPVFPQAKIVSDRSHAPGAKGKKRREKNSLDFPV